MKHILIVEDEKNIIELLKYNLENNNYTVDYATDGREGLELFTENKYDLILLDLMIPKINGLDLCKKIRSVDSQIPIIMLTAKSTENDKVKGLNIGADDYITKPFSVNELLARINVLFRRSNNKDTKTKQYGNLYFDFDNYIVYKNEEEVDLTLKEFDLLRLLIKNNGKPTSREEILEKVWGYEFIGETRTVDVHIRNIRSKIEADDKNPEYIKTVRGIGYRFGMI